MRFSLLSFGWFFITLACLSIAMASSAWGEVLISEVNFHPPDDGPEEFIELYNNSDRPVRLDGYRFTDGVLYEFRGSHIIQANDYYLVAKHPNDSAWSGFRSQVAGPYLNKLSNSGETLTLRTPEGQIADQVSYTDSPPWPQGADGYGPSMERIAFDQPGNDHRNWRASINDGGTPARSNSVADEPVTPFLQRFSHQPAFPTSADEVTVTAIFDGAETINEVVCQAVPVTTRSGGNVSIHRMEKIDTQDQQATFRATLPAESSQTLVRYKFLVRLRGGETVYWPHRSDPRPFESYFVYDDEIPTVFPLLWMFNRVDTNLPEVSGRPSGVVVKPVTGPWIVRDGANIISSRNGQKIRFIKGEEYRRNRTLNVIPERPTGSTTSGPRTPYIEHTSYEIFRDFDVLTPGSAFYRVIERGDHTRRLLIQQPNERFLAMNGRDPNANIYKIAYNGPHSIPGYPSTYEKKTNLDEPPSDFFELNEAIHSTRGDERAQNVRRYLDHDKVLNYSVASVLMSNWDGFFNNMFIYHHPAPLDIWEPIPWDCDKTFGYTEERNPQFFEMPIEFPLDGQARMNSRPPGFISEPFHSIRENHEEYKRWLRHELDHRFAKERIQAMVDRHESMLLEDIELEEEYTGDTRSRHRNDIIAAYDYILRFVDERHAFLRSQLPTAVNQWALYE